jgi:N-acetylmuramoyl-L-alanine amidase
LISMNVPLNAMRKCSHLILFLVFLVPHIPAPKISAKLKLVVLDPGHGGPENKGAPARMRPGRFEKHYTLPLARIVEKALP